MKKLILVTALPLLLLSLAGCNKAAEPTKVEDESTNLSVSESVDKFDKVTVSEATAHLDKYRDKGIEFSAGVVSKNQALSAVKDDEDHYVLVGNDIKDGTPVALILNKEQYKAMPELPEVLTIDATGEVTDYVGEDTRLSFDQLLKVKVKDIKYNTDLSHEEEPLKGFISLMNERNHQLNLK